MRQLKALNTICLILCFVLVIFSCATGKNQVANAEFGITAEAVPEGILITFNNLPLDTTHLWIGVTEWEGMEEPNSETSHYHYAAINDKSVEGWVNSTFELGRIKQTGSIIFPFVQTGFRYNVTAMVYNEQEFISRGENAANEQGFIPRLAFTDFSIENNGIYFNRDDVELVVNNNLSVVTLTIEPTFSSEVIFDDQKYSFGVRIIDADNNRSIGIGDHHFPEGLSLDGLVWTFEPYFTEVLKTDDVANEWFGNETFPARANVFANIIYDNIRWHVELANSQEFAYSL